MELGERIAVLREEQALTQAELADIAKISPSTLSQIESGRVPRPHVGTVRKIARALGVEPAELRRTKESAVAGKAEAPSPSRPPTEEPTLPKALKPRTLDELLERDGLETRWFTLPDDDFNRWWLETPWKQTIERFWQINAEFRVIAAETSASIQGKSTVAPELQRQLKKDYLKVLGKHFGAQAAAPGTEETEEEFYDRQSREELRHFKRIELEKKPEEVVALAS